MSESQVGATPARNDGLRVWQHRIALSYQRVIGEPLAADPAELYVHPWVLLCHGTQADPLFVYANLTAQRLWERTLAEFLGWPSRLTAPEEERSQRAAALASGQVVRGYSGVRVSATGRRFRILDAVIWPVVDDSEAVVGQAAAVPRWEYLDT